MFTYGKTKFWQTKNLSLLLLVEITLTQSIDLGHFRFTQVD